MIPHRMFSSDVFGSGLKGRVTACRKRLRVHRTTNRTHLSNRLEGVFSESSIPTPEFLDDPATVRQSEVPRMSAEADLSGGDGLQPVEQEVGIT